MKQHALSAKFPAMSDADYQALKLDIATHGLRNPITLYEGQVIDGWHRFCACNDSGIEPQFVELGEDEDPRAWVVSVNFHRRHLTESQKAGLVVGVNEWVPRGRPENQMGNVAHLNQMTTQEMADSAKVSERTIKHAKSAEKAGLGDQVRAGKASASAAAELAKKAPELAEKVAAGEMEFDEAKAQGKEKRSFAPPESMRLANLERDFQALAAQFDDARAELIELRAASYDPQLRAQAHDEIEGLREALQMEQEQHAALKAQRDIDQEELNTWKTRAQALERKLSKLERGM